MTNEDFERIDWRVTSAELRIAGMFCLLTGHEYYGAAFLLIPTVVDDLKNYLRTRRIRKEGGA